MTIDFLSKGFIGKFYGLYLTNYPSQPQETFMVSSSSSSSLSYVKRVKSSCIYLMWTLYIPYDLVLQISSSESVSDVSQPTGQMSVPQDRLSLLVRLCLTDSNFPAFVEAVEKELHSLTSSHD